MSTPESLPWCVEHTNITPSAGALEAALYIRPDMKDIPGPHGETIRHISAVTVQQFANQEVNAATAKLRQENLRLTKKVDSLNDYLKKMDTVIDEEHVADSCINPLEDLRHAVKKLRLDRDNALKVCEMVQGVRHAMMMHHIHDAQGAAEVCAKFGCLDVQQLAKKAEEAAEALLPGVSSPAAWMPAPEEQAEP